MVATDVEFSYMKIFRFLADILSINEFDSLSYYHVASFIQRVLKAISEADSDVTAKSKSKVSLRQFVCKALDLHYEQS